MVFLHRFQKYFSHIMATAHIIHVFLGFTSTRLGSEVPCPRTLSRKNPDPVWLEPRTPELRVKHFTTEQCGILKGFRNAIICENNQGCFFVFMLFTSKTLTHLEKKAFKNIVGKGNQHFLLFHQCFLLFRIQMSISELE